MCVVLLAQPIAIVSFFFRLCTASQLMMSVGGLVQGESTIGL